MVATVTYNPVWWGSMHAISSYRGNRPTHTHTHPPTHKQTGQITIHCAAASAQCNKEHLLLLKSVWHDANVHHITNTSSSNSPGGATIRCHFWNSVVLRQSRGLSPYTLCLHISSCIGSSMTHNYNHEHVGQNTTASAAEIPRLLQSEWHASTPKCITSSPSLTQWQQPVSSRNSVSSSDG